MDSSVTPTHDGFLVAVNSTSYRYFAKNKAIIFGNAATIGGTFEYKVKARYAKLGKDSDVVSTTLTITLPPAPVLSSVTANGSKTLTFNVSSTAGVTSFTVYRNGVPIRSVAPSSSITVDKLPGGLSTYQLRAFTPDGVSPPSAGVAIRVL
jgi:hypothetical protein